MWQIFFQSTQKVFVGACDCSVASLADVEPSIMFLSVEPGSINPVSRSNETLAQSAGFSTAAFQLLQVPRWCKRCVTAPSEAAASDAAAQMARTTRYWFGCLEEPVPGRQRTYQKIVDTGYMHQDFFPHAEKLRRGSVLASPMAVPASLLPGRSRAVSNDARPTPPETRQGVSLKTPGYVISSGNEPKTQNL